MNKYVLGYELHLDESISKYIVWYQGAVVGECSTEEDLEDCVLQIDDKIWRVYND